MTDDQEINKIKPNLAAILAYIQMTASIILGWQYVNDHIFALTNLTPEELQVFSEQHPTHLLQIVAFSSMFYLILTPFVQLPFLLKRQTQKNIQGDSHRR